MRAFEIVLSDEAELQFRMIISAASAPLTMEELLLRWLAKGVAFDLMRPEVQGEAFMRNFVKIRRK